MVQHLTKRVDTLVKLLSNKTTGPLVTWRVEHLQLLLLSLVHAAAAGAGGCLVALFVVVASLPVPTAVAVGVSLALHKAPLEQAATPLPLD